MLDDSLSAMSLVFLASIHRDSRLLNIGSSLHELVLKKIGQLNPIGRAHTSEDLIVVSMAMVLYEV